MGLLLLGGIGDPRPTLAADISKGYTFAPGEKNITHTKLNNLLDQATISSSFFTGKSAGTIAGADTLLFYSSSAGDFRKGTWNSILLQNSDLITSQSADIDPQLGDYLLTYDVSGTALAKATIESIWYTGLREATNMTSAGATPASSLWLPVMDASVAASGNGIGKRAQLQNLASGILFTNLSSATYTGTNGEQLWVWDATNGVNVRMAYNWFISTNAPMTNAGGTIMNQAHNLRQTPRIVRAVAVCTNAAGIAGYVANDEVPLSDFFSSGDFAPFFSFGANATNVFVAKRSSGALPELYNRTTGGNTVTDQTNWLVRVYARP